MSTQTIAPPFSTHTRTPPSVFYRPFVSNERKPELPPGDDGRLLSLADFRTSPSAVPQPATLSRSAARRNRSHFVQPSPSLPPLSSRLVPPFPTHPVPLLPPPLPPSPFLPPLPSARALSFCRSCLPSIGLSRRGCGHQRREPRGDPEPSNLRPHFVVSASHENLERGRRQQPQLQHAHQQLQHELLGHKPKVFDATHVARDRVQRHRLQRRQRSTASPAPRDHAAASVEPTRGREREGSEDGGAKEAVAASRQADARARDSGPRPRERERRSRPSEARSKTPCRKLRRNRGLRACDLLVDGRTRQRRRTSAGTAVGRPSRARARAPSVRPRTGSAARGGLSAPAADV